MIQIKLVNLSINEQANSVIELLNEYAQHPMGGGEALPEFTRKNLIATLNTRTDCSIFLAFDDNKAIGLCNCFETFSTFACKPLLNIHDLYVTETYRQKGIGRLLMQQAEQLARDKGCYKMTLEVLSKNEPAKKSYRASGYQPYQLDEQFGFAEFWQKLL